MRPDSTAPRNYLPRNEAVHRRVRAYVIEQIHRMFPGYYHLVEPRIDELVYDHSLKEILAIVQREVNRHEKNKLTGKP